MSKISTNLIPGIRMRGKGSDKRRNSSSSDRRRGSGGSADVFSDEEFYENTLTPSSSTANLDNGSNYDSNYDGKYDNYDAKNYETPPRPPNNNLGEPKKSAQKVSFSLPPHHSESKDEPADDVEQELDLFSKAIHISNIDEIDHVGLMRGMHERFQRKQLKWQRYASSYSKWAFAINFMILVMQIIQMLFHQLVEVFNGDSSFQETEPKKSSFTRSLYSSAGLTDVDLQHLLFNSSTLRAVRCVLSAATAVLAGLQMKLKLTEKAEKYRRGAKVYARLHRLSTYYLMLAENGGKVEDVTGLWRDAMKKEGKWIPVVKTFMAT